MIAKLVFILFVVVGLINFIPVVGIASATKLSSLYGIQVAADNLVILLRHRALMFGVLGGFIIHAAFNPIFRSVAYVIGFVSMTGFILLAWQQGGYNAEIKRVIVIDAIAIVLFLAALILEVSTRHQA